MVSPASRSPGAGLDRARRLVRAGLEPDVAQFRVEQVLWGLGAFTVVAVPAGFVAVASPERAVPLLVFCGGLLVTAVAIEAPLRRR